VIRQLALASVILLSAGCEQTSNEPVAATEPASAPEPATDPDTLLATYAAELSPLSPNWKGISKWTASRSRLEASEAALLQEFERTGSQTACAELGKIYTDVLEFDRALWFLCRALELDPKDIESWLSLGQHRLKRLKPKEVLVLMERVRELNPDHPFGWVLRGDAHFDLHELEPAEEAYREAVLLSPRILTAQLGLARVYETWGEFERAEEHLLRVLRVDEDEPTALFRLARVMRKLERFEEADDVTIRYERAMILEDRRIRKSKLSPSAKYLFVADTFRDDGRTEDAVREYQNARDTARSDEDRVLALAGLLTCARNGAAVLSAEALEEELRSLAPDHELLSP